MASDIVKIDIIAETQQAQNAISGMIGNLKNLVIVGGSVMAAFNFLKSATESFIEAEKESAKLSAVLKATGGAAGITKGELEGLASSLQKVTMFEDENIMAAESVLLTYKSINKDIFPKTLELAADLSSVFGQDLKSASNMLGKALEEPIQGMGALRRVGVTFNDEQKNTIKLLMESGEKFKAQNIILKAVEDQVGGTAKAMGETLGGKLEQLKNTFGDFMEEIGGKLAPIIKPVVESFINFFTVLKDNSALFDLILKPLAAVGEVMKFIIDTASNGVEKLRLWAEEVGLIRDVSKENLQALTIENKQTEELIKTITELQSKTHLTAIEKEKLKSATIDLSVVLPKSSAAFKQEGNEVKANIELLQQLLIERKKSQKSALEMELQEVWKKSAQIRKIMGDAEAEYTAELKVGGIYAEQRLKTVQIERKRWEEYGKQLKEIKDQMSEVDKEINKLAESNVKLGDRSDASGKKSANEFNLIAEALKIATNNYKEFNEVEEKNKNKTTRKQVAQENTNKELTEIEKFNLRKNQLFERQLQNEQSEYIKMNQKRFEISKKTENNIQSESEKVFQNQMQDYNSNIEMVKTMYGQLSSIVSSYNQIQINNLENEKNKKIEIIQSSIMSEKEKVTAQENIEKEYQGKISELKRKAFESNKTAATIEALINGALGVTKAYASMDPISATMAAMFIGALTATQVGVINSQPTPAFARGGSIETTKPTLFLAGDNPGGREKISISPSGGDQPIRVTINLDRKTLYSGLFQATKNREILIDARAVV